MKNFETVFNEIKDSISTNKSGKAIKTFSRSDFEKLTKAFLNEPGYTTQTVSMRNGEVTKKDVKPVELFRAMIKRVLLDFGVDKQAAETIIDQYEFKNVSGVYEVCSELITNFMLAGKKFDFLPKEDFVGSLTIDAKDESVTDHIKPKTKEAVKVKKQAHKVLKHKSSCPKWLKERL